MSEQHPIYTDPTDLPEVLHVRGYQIIGGVKTGNWTDTEGRYSTAYVPKALVDELLVALKQHGQGCGNFLHSKKIQSIIERLGKSI